MKYQKKASNKREIAIIGAGASGLSCAFCLAKNGYIPVVYERSDKLGGLANSIELSKGRIDSYYHHLFESDKYILNFLKKVGIEKEVIFRKAVTAHIWSNKYYDISGLINLFKSKLLSKTSFIRLLFGGAFIKYFPYLFGLKNKSVLQKVNAIFGKEAAEKIWTPLIKGKFGSKANLIPYSWLRTRIQDRSIKLGYVENGFESLYEFMVKEIKESGGEILLNKNIVEIKLKDDEQKIIIDDRCFERLLVSSSPKANKNLLKNLDYSSEKISYIGALCGIVEFSKKPVPAYWVGITPSESHQDKNYNDFLACISYAELDKSWNKKGESTWPTYIACYLTEDEFLSLSKEEWKNKMVKALIEISQMSMRENAVTEKDIISINLSFAEYAQPIISPSKGLVHNPEKAKLTYFANMHNIYPNDRGQNRAFLIGEKRAYEIMNSFEE